MTSSIHVCSVNWQCALVLVSWVLRVTAAFAFLGIWEQLRGTFHTCVDGSQGGVSVYSHDSFLKKKKMTSKGIKQRLKTQACTYLSGAIKRTLFTSSCLPALYRLRLLSSSFDWSSSNLLTSQQASPSLSHQPLWTVPALNYQSPFRCLDTTWGLFYIIDCILLLNQGQTDGDRQIEYLSSLLLENKTFKVRKQT